MIILTRHVKNNIRLYKITKADIQKTIEQADIEQRENDTFIAIKHIDNKFDNLPLKVVYAIENDDKIIITTYPLNRIHKLKDHESKL